ncbi:MAG: hypothetical protein ABJA66_16210, partial [Actinomycetota bacterium]
THLCQASKVGAKIFADAFSAEFQIEDKLSFTLNGGEDFELLFTVNPKKYFQMQKMQKNFSFHHIGEITSNTEIIELITGEKSQILESKGFRHF